MHAYPVLIVLAWGIVAPSSLLATPFGPPPCGLWSARTARGADKRSVAQWRDWTIMALADACDAIPVRLREAASRVRTIKDSRQQAEVLSGATTAILGPGCDVTDPLDDSRRLAKTCPLPPDLRFRLDEPTLSDIRAVDYAVLNAMLRALISANKFDEEAERVMLNFALSAQVLGEQNNSRGKPPAPSRGRGKK